ncbi:UDP-glycosyltransferase 73C7-like [Cynara cardunculus var. scolymus]|nr:UDP-glycosyltransferase 73C7-like [Cynara cardunculus var. scolymus]
MDLEAAADIFVLPFLGQGHLFPAMELCKNLSSHRYNVTLIIPSHLSSSIPSTFTNHSSFIHVVEISVSSPPETADEPGSGKKEVPPPAPMGNPLHNQNIQMGEGIKSFLSTGSGVRPTCVVIDVMMSWSKEIFVNHEVPVVSFFTSGAIASTMDYGKWKAQVGDMKPGEIRVIPGLPTQMAVTFADLSRGPRGKPQRSNRPADGNTGPPSGFRGRGPPTPGQKPRWLDEVDGSVALLINTCDHLERLFIDYLAEQTKLPVWGVGPLLPEQFWKSAGSILHDHDMRSNHKSNYTEDEVIQWLESKPYGSVIYISFGSEVGPSIEEYKELAKSLEESKQPFIWVIQPGSGKSGVPRSFLGGAHTDTEEEDEEEGYYPEGLDVKVGKRGLIITGWAPQLLILSHPSTGGFLSHCGWNSTVEAIGRGVPILAWSIRGDQFDNAKLVAKHLKIGHIISNEDGRHGKLKRDDIAAGIEKLMSDEKVRNQAKELSKEFESGFPVSSVNGLGAFVEFISSKAT